MITDAESTLELVAIDKSFGGVHALRAASLSARAGEIHALCGENGAGKSTMLKVLSGVHPRTSYGGTVRVHGIERAFTTTADARAAGIAIVHQELMLVPELSVAANLVLGQEGGAGGLFSTLDDDAIEKSAGDLLERFGVRAEIDPNAAAGSLGIGLQQVVEIIRALSAIGGAGGAGEGSARGKILVLDEPTAALTGRETDRLMEWLRALRAGGATCVYVSHRMDEVFALCDRVTVLRDGETVGTVDARETTADEVVSMMVGRAVSGKGRRAAPRTSTEGSPAALEVRALSLASGGKGVDALRDVSLSVQSGEVLAVCGAMGSGRTALLSTLFGAARGPVTGNVHLAGREVVLGSPRDAIARGIALIPEDRKGCGLVLGMTVSDNLSLPPRPSRVDALFEWLGVIDEDDEERIAKARIDALRIRGAADAEVATLSGGNQQKVVLGKWLEDPPKVLLLDEPTRGVDVGAREEIYALVEALTAKGTAVLLASSDLPEVLRLAHRVIVLLRGSVVATLDGRTVTEEEIVSIATGATQAPARPAKEAERAERAMAPEDVRANEARRPSAPRMEEACVQ